MRMSTTVQSDELLSSSPELLSSSPESNEYKKDKNLSISNLLLLEELQPSMHTLDSYVYKKGNFNSFNPQQQQQLQRIQHLREACADRTLFQHKAYKGRKSFTFYFAEKYNLSYCKVPKVGCSFWTQVFMILSKNLHNYETIFGMARSAIHMKLKGKTTVPFMSQARRRSRTVLVSRDPYSRLFSAFVDKMFLPLHYSQASKIVKKQRRISGDDFPCANITFQEFLKFIVEETRRERTLDRHWAPIFSLCAPCDVNALAVVKQESFSTDVEYSLKEIGVADDQYSAIYDALHGHRIEATIPGIVKTVLNKRKGKRCMSDLETAWRLWISFQIQGYLRSDIEFPFDIINTAEKASAASFLTDVILKTIRNNPLTSEESKTQRRQALLDAYAGVDTDVIEDIKKIYKQDFILFDYSFEPPS